MDGIMDEVAESFVRTAFSSVVRENNDFAFALMNAQGRQFVQSSRSIPSFIGIMPVTLKAMLEKYPPETLEDGDVLISNDPWIGAGHLNDITMIQPLFRKGRIVAFIGSTFHSVDIGGARSPHATERYAEGLYIPICRVVRRGEENADVMDFIRDNVRAPKQTLGDIRAQFGAYRIASQKLFAMMDEEGLDLLDHVTSEILERSEKSMRDRIRELENGEYTAELMTDGYDDPLRFRLKITVLDESMVLDFAGSSPQLARPVNSVLNYTRAYAIYAVKCALDPHAPNNEGSFRPIEVRAPEGCMLNPRPPAPIWARSLTGHYLPGIVFDALSQVIPERVIAHGGANWNIYFRGAHSDGAPFIKNYFMNGGHGARPNMDGPGCLSFPSNIANEPIERFENSAPILILEKCFVPDTGGPGRFRGGTSQRVSFKSNSDRPITATLRIERVKFPPRGLRGGGDGARGQAFVNGKAAAPKSEQLLNKGDVLTLQTAGGGGMLPTAERDPALAAADIENGFVTL